MNFIYVFIVINFLLMTDDLQQTFLSRSKIIEIYNYILIIT